MLTLRHSALTLVVLLAACRAVTDSPTAPNATTPIADVSFAKHDPGYKVYQSGSNGYNKYLMKLGADSVTSIVISSVAGANSDVVTNAIANAEVVFLAGGDQSTYVNLWRGTALEAAVNARVAQGYPIGEHGTRDDRRELHTDQLDEHQQLTVHASVSNGVVSSSTGSIY